MSGRLLLGLIFGVFVAVGIAVELFVAWLWFEEVGYVDVFLTTVGARVAVGVAVASIVLLFVFGNLAWLARRGAPDVLWELEQPPVLEFEMWLSRGLMPAVVLLCAVAGLAATAQWDTALRFAYRVPFGSTDPLFGYDVSFFVFELPLWRLLTSWSTRVVVATTLLVLLIYAMRRSVALTSRGPRIARAARSHLLALVGLFLLCQALEFWLDRFDLVVSRRGAVFGAAYADVHASLPVLDVLARLCLAVAVAAFVQIRFRGLRLLAGGMAILVLAWVGGLWVYPAVVQRFRVTPNELAAERPFIEHHIRMTRAAYGLERIEEREFGAGEGLDAAALARNAATIRSIRLWDHRPLHAWLTSRGILCTL